MADRSSFQKNALRCNVTRPLPFLLAQMSGLVQSTQAAAVGLASGEDVAGGAMPFVSSDVSGDLRALSRHIAGSGQEAAFISHVSDQLHTMTSACMRGLSRYLRSDYCPDRLDWQPVARRGSCQLISCVDKGRPLLLVPSLVNGFTIFDLMEERSLAAYLIQAGFRPLIVEWGAPVGDERQFGLEDYIIKRLLPLVDVAKDIAADHYGSANKGLLSAVGYCMGGTLLTAAACLLPQHFQKLALLAAPWDFAADDTIPARIARTWGAQDREGQAGQIATAEGVVPFDLLQSIFALRDPTLFLRKYAGFATMEENSDASHFFIALEQWANSGHPLSFNLVREVMQKWYCQNQPGDGRWVVGKERILSSKTDADIWVVAPLRDQLVPPASSQAIAENSKILLHQPDCGHVGMMVGKQRHKSLWQPLVDFLQ